jgi:uncharacterized protein (DUF608 family)
MFSSGLHFRRHALFTSLVVLFFACLCPDARAADIAPTRRDNDDSRFKDFRRYVGSLGGVPLGGLGAGTVEIRQDGSFRMWEVFNNWGGASSVGIWRYHPSYDLLNAFAAVKVDGKAFVLETRTVGGLPGVKAIDYRGEFPFANLRYTLPDGVPLELSLEAFSSYIPHRAEDSGIPAFGLTYSLKNPTDKPMEVSLAYSVVNPWGLQCEVQEKGSRTVAVCGDKESGLAIASLDAKPVNVPGGADTAETLKTFWSQFAGPVVWPDQSTGHGQRIAQIVNITIAPGQTVRQRFVTGWYFPRHSENGAGPLVGHRYQQRTDSPAASVELLAGSYEQLRAASSAWRDTLTDSSWPRWLLDWLVNSQSNNVKSSWWVRDGRFIMYESFHCPNTGPILLIDMGMWSVLDCFAALDLNHLRRWAKDSFPNGRLPEQYRMPSITFPDPIGSRDLVDIPSIYAMEIYRRYQATGDKEFLAETYPVVKRAIGYTHKTYDSDGDGLLDHLNGFSRHAWDLADLGYMPSYVNAQWLAGQRAAQELAVLAGDVEYARQLGENIEKGKAVMERELWNGEYYDMTADQNGRRNPLCMSAQVGEGFTIMLGLGSVLPAERMKSALRAIAKYNAPPTNFGIVIMADRNGKVFVPADRRVQILSCRTLPVVLAMIAYGDVDRGMELLHGISGLFSRANNGGLWNMADCIGADGKYLPNCFGNYVMNGGIWGAMKLLNGWIYAAPNQELTIDPILTPEKCHGPWITPTGYGVLRQNVDAATQKVRLETRSGQLVLSRLNVGSRVGQPGNVSVTLDGRAVPCTSVLKERMVQLQFEKPLTLKAGQTLTVTHRGK